MKKPVKIGLYLILALLVMLTAVGVVYTETPYNTYIINTAGMDYTSTNMLATYHDTATNQIQVMPWYRVEVSPDSGIDTGVIGDTIYYNHVITNLSNAPDSFALYAVSAQGWRTAFYLDTNFNSIFDTGEQEITQVINVSTRETAGDSVSILLGVYIPDTLVIPTVDTITITCSSLTSSYVVTDSAVDVLNGLGGMIHHFGITFDDTKIAGIPFYAYIIAYDSNSNSIPDFAGAYITGDSGLQSQTFIGPFDSAGNCSYALSTTLSGTYVVAVSDTTLSVTNYETIYVVPNVFHHYGVSVPDTAVRGVPFDLVVTARDEYGNTTARDTAVVAMIDSSMTLSPVSIAFTGEYSKTVSVTITKSGLQTITVGDTTAEYGSDAVTMYSGLSAALIYPDSGTVVFGTKNVTWTATSTVGSDVLKAALYLNDGAGNWQLITEGLDNNGSYSWNTTQLTDGESYSMKILVTNGDNDSVSDTTDGNFAVWNTPVKITGYSPADNQMVSSKDLVIWVKFSIPIKTDNLDNVIEVTLNGDKVNGSVGYDQSTRILKFTPEQELKPLKGYKVKVKDYIDLYDRKGEEKEWKFKTILRTDQKITVILNDEHGEAILYLEENTFRNAVSDLRIISASESETLKTMMERANLIADLKPFTAAISLKSFNPARTLIATDTAGTPVYELNKDAIMSISYFDENNDRIVDGSDIKESLLKMFVLNERKGEWELIKGSQSNGSGAPRPGKYKAPDDGKKSTLTIEKAVKEFSPKAKSVIAKIGILNKTYSMLEYTPPTKLAEWFKTYPNPFNPNKEKVKIGYFLEKPANVTVQIYNIIGEPVKTIAENEHKDAGLYEDYEWDGKNGEGVMVLNGTYICRIKAVWDDGSKTELYLFKIAVLK